MSEYHKPIHYCIYVHIKYLIIYKHDNLNEKNESDDFLVIIQQY